MRWWIFVLDFILYNKQDRYYIVYIMTTVFVPIITNLISQIQHYKHNIVFLRHTPNITLLIIYIATQAQIAKDV